MGRLQRSATFIGGEKNQLNKHGKKSVIKWQKKLHILHFWASHFIHIAPKNSQNSPSEAFRGQNSLPNISLGEHC